MAENVEGFKVARGERNKDERLRLCRERALLILRIARETYTDAETRLSRIEGEAEHFYFIATHEPTPPACCPECGARVAQYTDGSGEWFCSKCNWYEERTTEAAQPLTPKSPASNSRSGVVCRPTEGRQQ